MGAKDESSREPSVTGRHSMSEDLDSRASTVTLWGVGTPRTLRAHWALHELSLPYRTQAIRPRSDAALSPAYASINASQKVPTLVDGDLILTESGAIVNYLLRRYGAESGLQPPSEPGALARYDEWAFFSLMELDAASMYVIRRHLDMPHLYGDAPAAVGAARDYCARALQAADARLGDTPFLLGDRMSGADILFTTCLANASTRGIPLPSGMAKYLRRMTSRAPYRQALEVNRAMP